MSRPNIIKNQPKEKPLFGIDTDSEGKKWLWRDSVTDEATLSKHDRLMGDTQKASFQFGKVTP
jgi:hypothetical protein